MPCAQEKLSTCHNRWHPDIKPAATANPGDTVIFETRDALDGPFQWSSGPKTVAAANLNLVHPLTGPLFVNGAERGDVLAVTVLDVIPGPDRFGYTIIVPGFGFLRDAFPNPYIVHWKLLQRPTGVYYAISDDLPGVELPLHGFTGTIGVALGMPEIEIAYLSAQRAFSAAFVQFLQLGVMHIFTGYDHILFLLDLAAHGAVDPLAQLLAKRLTAQEIRVVYSEPRGRYRYDQDAFAQYLKLAPNGPHRAEARFQILSGTFYATLAPDPAQLDAADRTSVVRAAIEEESFLKEFPRHPRAREVRFFLGVDCYRLSRNTPEHNQAAKYSRCARRALGEFVELYPDSMEARGAATLLENLSYTKEQR